MTEIIRVILIDDHMHVHEAIAEMFDLIDGIDLIAQGSNGEEACQLASQHLPHVILMDILMPKMNGIEATQNILQVHPEIKIIALSSFQDRDSIQAMLECGAVGYILKDGAVDDIEDTIRLVFKGKAVLSGEVMSILQSMNFSKRQEAYNLTPRELEVLELMARGMTNSEIADELTISYSTVRFHIVNITSKMDVNTRAEAVALASKSGLV